LTRGSGVIDGEKITDGDLVKGNNLTFQASEDTQLIVVST
jgi:hypothetical protein